MAVVSQSDRAIETEKQDPVLDDEISFDRACSTFIPTDTLPCRSSCRATATRRDAMPDVGKRPLEELCKG
jgi:hypothetical protein